MWRTVNTTLVASIVLGHVTSLRFSTPGMPLAPRRDKQNWMAVTTSQDHLSSLNCCWTYVLYQHNILQALVRCNYRTQHSTWHRDHVSNDIHWLTWTETKYIKQNTNLTYLNASQLNIVEKKPHKPVYSKPDVRADSKQVTCWPRRINSKWNAFTHWLKEASSYWHHVQSQSKPSAGKSIKKIHWQADTEKH